MKTIFIAAILILSGPLVLAQDKDITIEWSYSVSKDQVKPGDEIDLVFKAKIPKDWYLYSSDFSRDLGPKVTTFTFVPHESYELVGEIMPIGPSKKYDDIWEGEYTYFTGTAEFHQRIKVKAETVIIKGNNDYQVCSDIDGKCIPFKEDFSFALNK